MTDKIKNEFIYRVGKIGKQWGMGEPAGKVWGVLLFNKMPLTQKEIANQCRYSIGLVSRSINLLENLGMITDVGKKEKEKLYNATITAIDFFGKLMQNFMEQNIRPIISLLELSLEKEKDNAIKSRMNVLIKDYSTINSMLELFSKMLESKKSSIKKPRKKK